VEQMNAATAHRGPDGMGVFVGDGVTLGHARLSVLDLSAAASQPMHSADGRYVIAFNGEVYNFGELKAELPEYGFKTTGDTEVVLAAFTKWGTDAFRRFDGMFAVAIYDRAERALILARDRMGIKPLYYSLEGNALVFSSEIKAILATGVSRALDMDAFDAYMRLPYVPGPATAFKSVRKLLPGTCATYRNGHLDIMRFAPELKSAVADLSMVDASKAVEAAVDTAVRAQLVSDRPLGIYLSGGIDSSVVLDAASRLRPGIDTFSVGFELTPGEEPDKFNADFAIAEQTAARYGATHHGFLIKPDEVLPAFIEAVRHLDEPLNNPTVIPMIILAQRTKEAGVDVVLCGDGGDELFGGYERHRWSARADLYQRLPRIIRRVLSRIAPRLAKLDDMPGAARYERFHFQKEKQVRELMGAAYRDGATFKESFRRRFAASPGSSDFAREFLLTDRETWLVDESLLKGDKTAMAHGLEVRVPLLDDVVVDTADTIPSRHKAGIFDTKKVLKKAFKHRLPGYLYKQPKRGWQSPGAKWLRHSQIAAFARTAFAPGYHPATDGLFDWPAVNTMLDDHISKKRYNLTPLWSVLAFRVWAKEFDVTL
jgi:asparagine synthase (glutamine-hydrolysing)